MDLEKIGVVGATGYSGQELIHLLSGHPRVELACVTSRQQAGERVDGVYPRFRGGRFGGLRFVGADAEAIVGSGAKIVFLALPHGLANEFAGPLLEAGLRVIDLSADFRIKDPAVYQEFYGAEHPAPALLKRSVYGMPELYREQIKGANLVAAPGCYPTSILIPLVPLLQQGLIDPANIVISSASGVTGAGRKVEVPYLFAECNESARAYGAPKHRHLAEVEQELSGAAGGEVIVSFVPHLIPINRGIITTIHVRAREGVEPDRMKEAWAGSYVGEPFVRLLGDDDFPDIKNVVHTNFIDLAARHDQRTGWTLLFSAEDNLVKGASGQAVQCLNIMCGWPETTGLLH